ncbi:MAG: LexA, partial [uncultured Rubrobacteraceae bacterium]
DGDAPLPGPPERRGRRGADRARAGGGRWIAELPDGPQAPQEARGGRLRRAGGRVEAGAGREAHGARLGGGRRDAAARAHRSRAGVRSGGGGRRVILSAAGAAALAFGEAALRP